MFRFITEYFRLRNNEIVIDRAIKAGRFNVGYILDTNGKCTYQIVHNTYQSDAKGWLESRSYLIAEGENYECVVADARKWMFKYENDLLLYPKKAWTLDELID